MHVQHAHPGGTERLAQRVQHRLVAADREVRHRFQQVAHGTLIYRIRTTSMATVPPPYRSCALHRAGAGAQRATITIMLISTTTTMIRCQGMIRNGVELTGRCVESL